MKNWCDLIDRSVDDTFADLVLLRRYLHAHPEPSGSEVETVNYLHQWLQQRDVVASKVLDSHGLIVDLGSTNASPRFALRADTDALLIQDQKKVAYRSTVENTMHACGHDVHSTILAGALVAIQTASKEIGKAAQVRGVFQPAEEICVGAAQMIREANAIDGVAAILACHVDPFRDVGTFGFRAGAMAAGCDELLITIRGEGGHAARPHHTRDPITAAAQFLNAVHVQIPRGTDSLDTVVIGFGSINGGEQCNVIPDEVRLRGTLRTLTPETRAASLAQVKEIAKGVEFVSQTQIEIQIGANTPSVINDPTLADLVFAEIERGWGTQAAHRMHQPSMGGEDFAYYVQHVPGFLVRLGSRTPGNEATGLHTPNFDVDEEVIRHGARLMARVATSWLANNQAS